MPILFEPSSWSCAVRAWKQAAPIPWILCHFGIQHGQHQDVQGTNMLLRIARAQPSRGQWVTTQTTSPCYIENFCFNVLIEGRILVTVAT